MRDSNPHLSELKSDVSTNWTNGAFLENYSLNNFIIAYFLLQSTDFSHQFALLAL